MLDIQLAIYNLLNGAISCHVSQNIKQSQTFPYVSVGDDTIADWSTDDKDGFDATITIHSWSRSGSMAQIKGIMSEIYDTMHRNSALNAMMFFEYGEVLQDPDGVTTHGVQRFRLQYFKE